jgi:hypothetical protein
VRPFRAAGETQTTESTRGEFLVGARRECSGACFDPDQKKPKYFFSQGRLFFRAINYNSFLDVSNTEDFAMARIPVKIQERAGNVPSTQVTEARKFLILGEARRHAAGLVAGQPVGRRAALQCTEMSATG